MTTGNRTSLNDDLLHMWKLCVCACVRVSCLFFMRCNSICRFQECIRRRLNNNIGSIRYLLNRKINFYNQIQIQIQMVSDGPWKAFGNESIFFFVINLVYLSKWWVGGAQSILHFNVNGKWEIKICHQKEERKRNKKKLYEMNIEHGIQSNCDVRLDYSHLTTQE